MNHLFKMLIHILTYMIYNIFFVDITTDEKLITYFYAKREEKIIVHIKIKNSRYDLFFMCIHFIP